MSAGKYKFLKIGLPNGEASKIIDCEGVNCNVVISGFERIEMASASIFSSKLSIKDAKEFIMDENSEIITVARGFGIGEGPGCNEFGVSSSHGGLGVPFCSDNVTPKPVYGDIRLPTTLGSGGTRDCVEGARGGGAVSIHAINITIDGTIDCSGEEGYPGCNQVVGCQSRKCHGSSGGSILISGENIFGEGTINAKGGSATKQGSGGGGGRISILSDGPIPQNLLVSVSGGLGTACSSSGSAGSFHKGCVENSCANGGLMNPETCECACEGFWEGKKCTQCSLLSAENNDVCGIHGRIISANTKCSCECDNGWYGEKCENCDSQILCNGKGTCDQKNNGTCSCKTHWVGDTCDKSCDPSEKCNGNGFCMDDATCKCDPDFIGFDCGCKKESISCTNETTCSGNGSCDAFGGCECDIGFVGCNCEFQCTASSTCSSHGICKNDGSCACDFGYEGDDCGFQNIEKYCADNDTISGYPCLPGFEKLGVGFDASTGVSKGSMLQFVFSGKSIFRIPNLGTYEIPDNVECKVTSLSSIASSNLIILSTEKLRKELALGAGINVLAFKKYMFGANVDYQNTVSRVFESGKFLSKRRDEFHLYECRMDQTSSLVNQRAQNAFDQAKTKQDFMKQYGTHITTTVTYGASIEALSFSESCLLQTMSESGISGNIDVYFADISGSSKLDQLNREFRYYSTLKSIVQGGETKYVDNNSIRDYAKWRESISILPAKVKQELNEISRFFNISEDEIESYVRSSQENINEIEISKPGAEMECIVPSPSPGNCLITCVQIYVVFFLLLSQ